VEDSARRIRDVFRSPHLAAHRVETDAAPRPITRTPAAVTLEFDKRHNVSADQVVLACHGDEVLPPSAIERRERAVFKRIRQHDESRVVHTDASFLPPAARARGTTSSAPTARDDVSPEPAAGPPARTP
jgi:predicted NAD/FAD-binding protein